MIVGTFLLHKLTRDKHEIMNELATFDENRLGVGKRNPMRDKN